MLRNFTVSIAVEGVEVIGTSASVTITGSEENYLIDTNQIPDVIFTKLVEELDAYVITDQVKADDDKSLNTPPKCPTCGTTCDVQNLSGYDTWFCPSW